MKLLSRFSSIVIIFLFSLILSKPVHASHSWGGYHWARTSNPFSLKLGDNVSSIWDSYLGTTSFDWSASNILDTAIVSGNARTKQCKPTSGMVEVCNASYGKNGWLGIAQIWLSSGHITQGITKVNDTYFNTAAYNKPAWRNLVLCQEVGHTFGLDHQDENFTNPPLGTCMDYTNDPILNQHPNAHDYEELETIYGHLDSYTSAGFLTPFVARGNYDNPSDWGKLIKSSSGVAKYERDFGLGERMVTFVIYAE